ncbi:MAG: ATP-binding protein [Candidatus Bathyarchaeia archaeon]|jgi:PAS domain S-box-containing protein
MTSNNSGTPKHEIDKTNSDQLYRTLFEATDEPFQLVKPLFDKGGNPYDFLFLSINKAFEKQLGIKATDIIGKTAKQVFPDLEQYWIEMYREVLTIGKLMHYENYNKATNRWFDLFYFPYGKGTVAVLYRDITQRKQAEKSLKKAQAKLQEYTTHLEELVEERTQKIRESQQSYRELYESFGEAFIATDWEFNVIHWNKVAERVTQVKAEDALGKKVYAVLPEFLTVDITPYLEALKQNKPARFMMNTVSRETRKPSIFEISTYPSKQGIIYIVEDKTQEEETKRLSAIGATAGMVGHDIRNPLQAILSDTFLINEELKSIPECKNQKGIIESIESIEKNISYINKIVQDLQDYSRPIMPEYLSVNISDFFMNIFKNINVPNNVNLSVNVENAKKVYTDPLLLQRAVTNLVNNAIQAMPTGGNLIIQVKQKENKIVIAIEDTGVGIPDEVKPKLFTPMVTTKSKGQGFGLAVSKRLIESLKGMISFESEVGKGTKFIIELPLK